MAVEFKICDKAGFFNSSGGDRLYDAEDFNNYLDGIIEDGCYPNDTGFKVLQRGESIAIPSVKISAGKAYRNGMWCINDTEIIYELPVQTSHNIYHYLYIMFDINEAAREAKIVHHTTDVVDYQMVSASGTYYLPLARITDNHNVQIVTADIRDDRLSAGTNAIVADSGVSTSKIAANAVTLAKLATTGFLLAEIAAEHYSAGYFSPTANTWYGFLSGGALLTSYTPAININLIITGGMTVSQWPTGSAEHITYMGVDVNGTKSDLANTIVEPPAGVTSHISLPFSKVIPLTAGVSYTISLQHKLTASSQRYNYMKVFGTVMALPR